MEEIDLVFKQSPSLHHSDPPRLKVVLKETEPRVNIPKLLISGLSAITLPSYIFLTLYVLRTPLSKADGSYLWKSVLLALLLLMGYHLHVASKTIAGMVARDCDKKEREERWIHAVKFYRSGNEEEGVDEWEIYDADSDYTARDDDETEA